MKLLIAEDDITYRNLLAAMARSPQSATRVRESLERLDGGEADQLYPILCGYSEDELREEGALKLVRYLSHDKLIFRVLSGSTLKRITGLGLGYSPEDTEAKHKSSVRRWTDRLKKREIVPKGTSLRKKKTPEKTEPKAAKGN